MNKKGQVRLSHEFVEFIPENLQESVLYISIVYATAVHRCFCGCGREVVTPLSPTDWSLTFNGETTSLSPSIGNWSFPCRSHYWIEGNCVLWCSDMSQKTINAGRVRDRQLKVAYFGDQLLQDRALSGHNPAVQSHDKMSGAPDVEVKNDRTRVLTKLMAWLRLQL